MTLTPVSLWEVHGSEDPATLDLQLATISGPDVTRLVTLEAASASVLHFRYSASVRLDRGQGRSPHAQLAYGYSAGSGTCSKRPQAGELNFTQQQVLTPRRNQGDYGLADSLAPGRDPEGR